MTKTACLSVILSLMFLQHSFALAPGQNREEFAGEDREEEAFKEEAKWHFSSAQDQLKGKDVSENDRKEAVRILNEVVDCYDADFLEAYSLLVKLYGELGDEKNKSAVEERYRSREKYLKGISSEENKEVYSKDPGLDTALRLLGSENPEESSRARIEILERLKKSDLTPELSSALLSVNTRRARRAADLLGEAKSAKAVPALGSLLLSSSPSLKIRALLALSKIGDDAAIPYFIKAFSDDYYSHYDAKFTVRENASEALYSVFKGKALPLLHEALKDERLRWYALETLNRYSPDGAVIEALKTALSDQDEKVVLAALKGIGKLENYRQFLPKLISLASSGTHGARVLAIKAAGRRKEFLETDVRALSDKDKYVVREAVRALASFKLDEVKDALLGLADDEKADVAARWHAIRALGENYRQNSAFDLEKLLDNDNFWVRSAAASALGVDVSEKKESGKPAVSKSEAGLDLLALKLMRDSGKIYEENRQAALRKTAEFLFAAQETDGHINSKYFPLGATQLAVICLASRGYNESDGRFKKAVEYVLAHRNKDGSYFSECESEQGKISYLTAYGIRALASTRNDSYSKSIRESLAFLGSIQEDTGGFGYFKGSRDDLSATETVISGLSAGYNFLGKRKTDELWMKASVYIKDEQNKDGGFGYMSDDEIDRSSYGSMTAAGLTCLMLLNKDKSSVEVKGALNWLGKNYTLAENPKAPSDKHYPFYLKSLSEGLHLTGISSIKDEKGFEHLWFEELAEKLIKTQRADGAWTEKWYEPVLAAEFYMLILQSEELKESGLGLN